MARKGFSRSKRTATRCSFLMNASLIKVSIQTIWSMVFLLGLKPVCRFERRYFRDIVESSLRRL